MDTSNLESIFGIVNFNMFVTVTALEKIARSVLPMCSLVVNTDLSILSNRVSPRIFVLTLWW